uniref:Uncharacterized protein n=1 Tax=Cavia porcellus TaxID=10141 RepID=A0A286XUG6_CAVPO
ARDAATEASVPAAAQAPAAAGAPAEGGNQVWGRERSGCFLTAPFAPLLPGRFLPRHDPAAATIKESPPRPGQQKLGPAALTASPGGAGFASLPGPAQNVMRHPGGWGQ